MPKIGYTDVITGSTNYKETIQQLVDNIEFLLNGSIDSDNLLNINGKNTQITEGKVAGLASEDFGLGGEKFIANPIVLDLNRVRPFFNPNGLSDGDKGYFFDYLKYLKKSSRLFCATGSQVFSIGKDVTVSQSGGGNLFDTIKSGVKAGVKAIGSAASSLNPFGGGGGPSKKLKSTKFELFNKNIVIQKTPNIKLATKDKLKDLFDVSIIPYRFDVYFETNISYVSTAVKIDYEIVYIDESFDEIVINIDLKIPAVTEGDFLTLQVDAELLMEELI